MHLLYTPAISQLCITEDKPELCSLSHSLSLSFFLSLSHTQQTNKATAYDFSTLIVIAIATNWELTNFGTSAHWNIG